MATPSTTINWTNTRLVPMSGLEAWHKYDAGVSGNNIVYDSSGNGRTIQTLTAPHPVLTSNVINGQPAWYFNGTTTSPFIYTGAVTAKHIFILASAADATFSTYRGLLSDSNPYSILVGESQTTKFYDYSATFTSTYRKSDVVYTATNQQAPVSGAFALIEIQIPAGLVLDGIQVGQQTNLTDRKWKGYFVDQLIYNRILTTAERRAVMLYFNLHYAQFLVGVPLRFPDDSMLTFRRSRFYAAPPDYDSITDDFEFEDGSKTFNEVADNAPRRWEYEYGNCTPDEVVVFDEFYNQVRKIKPFYFRDKYGVIWDNVRVERYSRQHQAHKSWTNAVAFDLVGYNSTGVLDA